VHDACATVGEDEAVATKLAAGRREITCRHVRRA